MPLPEERTVRFAHSAPISAQVSRTSSEEDIEAAHLLAVQLSEQMPDAGRRAAGPSSLRASRGSSASSLARGNGTTNKTAGSALLGTVSHAAAAAGLSCALMVAFAASVVFGCAFHEPDPLVSPGLSRSSLNPLLPYDWLLRRAGPLVPMILPLLRTTPEPVSKTANSPSMPSTLYTVSVYGAMAIVRILIYMAFLPGGILGPPISEDSADLHDHWMSDHILLGTSMTGQFAAEIVFLVAYFYRSRLRVTATAARLGIALIMAVVLWVFTTIDMHYTARFFHPVDENIRAWGLGLVLFQVPLATWSILQAK